MILKKKLTVLLIGALSICLFFAFGFQIDVSGTISKDGGTASVSLTEPLRVAAEEASAELAAAQMALEEALAAQEAVELVVANLLAAQEAAQEAVDKAQADLEEAQKKIEDTEALLIGLAPESPQAISLTDQLETAKEALIAAQLALQEALAAQEAVGLIAADPLAAQEAAQEAVDKALADLEAAQSAADAALLAFSGLKTGNTEELEDLQQIVDEARAALKEAMEAEGEVDEGLITELELAVKEAEEALEEFDPEENENGVLYSHIVVNSNNGGSFTGENIEGNYSGVDGDELDFVFESKEGYDLAWLRIGNIKIKTMEDIIEYLENFDKKNLTIHAHFKKDKDYSLETIEEEADPGSEPDEEVGQEDEDGDKKDKGKGKGKDKEKSNNGKNKKK